jgi:SAM-dependent methyltransferase
MQPSTVQPPPLASWSAGEAAIASRTLLTSELLCESVDLHAGERVLDVACGSGNAALAAARRFCRVVGVEPAPELRERARMRGRGRRAGGGPPGGGAEDLPFPDGSFEVVLSASAAIGGPDPECAVGELLRACRPGGRIGMVAWTPGGFVGEAFATIRRHLPRAGMRLPAPWGSRERLRELFGPEVAIAAPRRSLLWRFPSAAHLVEFFASFHGPTVAALGALGPDRGRALRAELHAVARRFDVSEDDTLVLQLDYLEVVVRQPAWR